MNENGQGKARIPLMVTTDMRQRLQESGFSEDEIKHMTPSEAWELLGGLPDPIDYYAQAQYYVIRTLAGIQDGNFNDGLLASFVTSYNEIYAHGLDGQQRIELCNWIESEIVQIPYDLRAKAEMFLLNTVSRENVPDPVKNLADMFDVDANPPPLSLLTSDYILSTDWPEPVWAIPEYLPVGLAILGGKAKVGKSWLGLEIARAVCTGGIVLGQQVEKGPILYLALEDPPRRLKERMELQGWPRGLQADFMPMGSFLDQIGDLKNGGGEKLARQIEMCRYRLCVIDTLSRSIFDDQNDVPAMTQALTPLQEIGHRLNCCVFVIDHHNKLAIGNDVVSDILGSTAKGAMADTILGLYRERGKAGAKLALTGREIIEQTLSLTMDPLSGCWTVEGDADTLLLTERRQEILDALEVLGSAGVVEIAKAIAQPKSHTYSRLQDLVNVGLVTRTSKGTSVYYELPEEDI